MLIKCTPVQSFDPLCQKKKKPVKVPERNAWAEDKIQVVEEDSGSLGEQDNSEI